MGLLLKLLVLTSLISTSILAQPDLPTPLPLVIWHGLGDNYQAEGLQSVAELAARVNPGTFVHNVRLDDDASSDRTATFFGNTTLQIEKVCNDIFAHPILSLAPAINALGFSQGGQFLRAYIERCNDPPVRNLVTFGSQHNGIAGFRNCAATDWVCKAAIGLLKSNTWSEFVQARVVPAQYYRDPAELEAYLEHSNFLADINNERFVKNQMYKENLMSLEKFAMFMFQEDKTVIPKETAWFAEVNMTTGNVTWLQDRDIYREDWLGLKTMNEQGKLDFILTDGGHMHLTDELLNQTFEKYFSPPRKEGVDMVLEL
ncbi:MAG: hypothetical protein M1823_005574 [Watsoniomyces obsoletus]|nr:MAG: hypothetical protein M1823_005574 [Watsoniomyces obsoletus]